jgi:hypothetical protein
MVSTTVKRTLSLSVVIGTMQTRRQEGASESIILVHPIDADDEKIVVAHVPMLARWDSPRRSSHREHLLSPHHVIAPRTTPHHEFSGLCVFCNLGTAKTDIKIRHQGKYCYPIYFPI